MSEADVNISSLSQDLTSTSPLCVEISGTISDLPQNEIKNVKGKNESNITLSEDIYNTIDSLIGDINIEKYSDSVPADSGISSFRQFEPVCKFHWTEAFNDETATFSNPTEGLYYTEKSKLQNHMSNYEEDSNTKKDLVEENQVKIIISTKEDLLANKSVSKHSKSPPLIHYYGEKLAKSTAKGPAFISTQPQSPLYKQSDSEEPSSKETSFTLLELRTNYKTEETKMNHSSLLLNCSSCEEENLHPPDEKRTQLTSNVHNLLTLIVGLLTCQATGFDSFDANKINDVPILLETKLHKYHNLNEELDFLIAKLGHLLASKEDHCNRLVEQNDEFQRHLGNLIDKVTSYEEIIECADQRLQISHSQIAHLEERNKHLENLIRRPREKTRKLKPRRLENHPKSMTVIGHHDDHFKEYYITM